MIKNISIIGAGNLANAILSGISRSNNSYNITLIDIDKNKKNLAKKYNVNFSNNYSNNELESDLVFLVVKPKEYKILLKKINPFLSKNTILLSFMAGVKHDEIESHIDKKITIVRCMANLTIKNFKSYIFYFSKSLSKKNDNIFQDFFSQFSKLKKCKIEDDIDKLTALYGSGPAYYVFYNKILRESFIKMGYSQKDSREYANDLLEGTTTLIKENNNLDKIIDAVASKGGTTEAALSEFKKNKINKIFLKGIVNAYKKSKNILKK